MDIDFDGAAPASAQKEPSGGLTGLEGLAGTPVRVESPTVGSPPAPAVSNNLDDLLGVFGDGSAAPAPASGANGTSAGADLLNGLSGLDLSGSGNASSTAPSAANQKRTNEDILSLF